MKNKSFITNLLFIGALIFISFAYNYQEILFYRPYSNHTWRQADCLSITMNYYKENLNFFTPEVHWTGDRENGKTISEFPIIYYTVAQLWKIFGQQEFIYRLINILIVFSGLFSLFKLSERILKDTFWSFFVPLIVFTSPLLIFYTNNFLSNAPAFGLALTGTYFFYRYDEKHKKKWLILSMAFFTLSGLLKITSLIIFMAILGTIVLDGIIKVSNKKQTIKSTLLKIVPFLCVLAVIAIWYLYARYYNAQNHRNLFLQDIFPIWELPADKRSEIANSLYWNLLPSYFNKEALLGIVLLFLLVIVFRRKVTKKYLSVLVISFIGIILYSLLWFKAFDVHDYYLTNLLIFIPLTLIVFFDFIKNNSRRLYKSIFLKVGLLLVLLFLISQGALKTRLKYDSKKYIKYDNIFIQEDERNYWEYIHWDYGNNFKAFETITPYLRSLGIKRTDKVICMSDASINISLYFMDQKGLTKYGYAVFSDKERVEFAIKQGCKYLIVNDRDLENSNSFLPYLSKQIGKYENINIYKL